MSFLRHLGHQGSRYQFELHFECVVDFPQLSASSTGATNDSSSSASSSLVHTSPPPSYYCTIERSSKKYRTHPHTPIDNMLQIDEHLTFSCTLYKHTKTNNYSKKIYDIHVKCSDKSTRYGKRIHKFLLSTHLNLAAFASKGVKNASLILPLDSKETYKEMPQLKMNVICRWMNDMVTDSDGYMSCSSSRSNLSHSNTNNSRASHVSEQRYRTYSREVSTSYSNYINMNYNEEEKEGYEHQHHLTQQQQQHIIQQHQQSSNNANNHNIINNANGNSHNSMNNNGNNSHSTHHGQGRSTPTEYEEYAALTPDSFSLLPQHIVAFNNNNNNINNNNNNNNSSNSPSHHPRSNLNNFRPMSGNKKRPSIIVEEVDGEDVLKRESIKSSMHSTHSNQHNNHNQQQQQHQQVHHALANHHNRSNISPNQSYRPIMNASNTNHNNSHHNIVMTTSPISSSSSSTSSSTSSNSSIRSPSPLHASSSSATSAPSSSSSSSTTGAATSFGVPIMFLGASKSPSLAAIQASTLPALPSLSGSVSSHSNNNSTSNVISSDEWIRQIRSTLLNNDDNNTRARAGSAHANNAIAHSSSSSSSSSSSASASASSSSHSSSSHTSSSSTSTPSPPYPLLKASSASSLLKQRPPSPTKLKLFPDYKPPDFIQTQPDSTSMDPSAARATSSPAALASSSSASSSPSPSMHSMPHLPFMPFSSFHSLQPLVQGNFSQIWCATLPDSTRVVIKVPRSPPSTTDWSELLSLLHLPQHPSVASIKGICPDFKYLPFQAFALVFQRERMNLKEYVKNIDWNQLRATTTTPSSSSSNDMVDPPLLLFILLSICSGIKHLHSHHYLHRDISARNYLITYNNEIQLIDFGLICHQPPSSSSSSSSPSLPSKLPLRWWSPESLLSHRFSSASDVWSLGVCAWEIVHNGAIPYQQYEANHQVIACVCSGVERLSFKGKCSTQLENILSPCFALNPSDRPSVSTLHSQLQHLLHQQHPHYDNTIALYVKDGVQHLDNEALWQQFGVQRE